ncbi:MAG: hypothetical protein OXF52_05935 [Candidatus Dadabacteria bacterium]|nr:hypothetical protein [Candidatus Dadabacteria bacterium]
MKKSLLETNPYLKDPAKYRKSIIAHVASSTAVETGASVDEVKKQVSGVIGRHRLFGTKPEPKS